MIVRPEADRLLLITQPAHARLARTVMEHCAPLATHPRREAILRAVGEHDAGWAESDAAPLVDPDGAIADFVRAPLAVRQGVWSRSVGALADDAWAAALVAHHAITVYDRFKPDAAWSAFFADLAGRRARLVQESGLSLDALEEDYVYVRLGDLLSLAFCTGIETPHQVGDWTVQRQGSRVHITPDAFGGGAIPMVIDAVDLPARRFVDAADLHREMRAAATRTITGEVGAFALDPAAHVLRAMTAAVVERSLAHLASLPSQPVMGDVHDTAFVHGLREPAPEHGAALAPVLDLLFDECVPRSFTASAPGYLAYIPGGGVYPAALADYIADTVNRYTGVWQAAPALVQLEANALDWLRDWMGFPPDARGLFTTGGSMATFNAILCARERYLGTEIRRGVLYTSDQAHHSVLKSAKLAGIMPDRVRALPCDQRYRLPVDALAEAVARDRRDGLVPFSVVSSAGTTNTGAVDPLAAIADVCAREGLWHHVDGAYGACFQLCDDTRPALAGLSRADSITLDPHKGLFLPYGTGAVLVRDGAWLRAAHEATADYLPAMPHPEDFYDPSQHGPELSRGYPGLRVWLSVKLFGAKAFRDALADKRALALDAARRVAALPGIVIDAPPELSLFAFHLTWPGASRDEEDAATRALMEQTTARGRVMVTGAVARGRYVGRVCVLSFRTYRRQIDQLVEDMAAATANILPRHV